MTAMNVVHARVKPGKVDEFIAREREFEFDATVGCSNMWLVRAGERDFIFVGEWDSMDALAAARPAMIESLERVRPLLEDLGGGRGVTEPWSGEVALHMGR